MYDGYAFLFPFRCRLEENEKWDAAARLETITNQTKHAC